MAKKRFILLGVLALSLGIPVLVRAIPIETAVGRTVVVGQDQTIADNFVSGAETIEINGTVEGDVIVAASTVTITGIVAGDVLAVAGTVRITGAVAGNVRVAAGNFDLSGHVERNVTVASGTMLLAQTSVVDGTAAFAAGTAELRGSVQRNVDGTAGAVSLAGTAGENVRLDVGDEGEDASGTLVLLPSAVITGDLIYTSARPADIRSGATIGGTVTQKEPSGTAANFRDAFRSFWLFAKLVALFGALVVGLVAVSLFRGDVHVILAEMRTRPIRSIGYGILGLVLTPLVAALLVATVIGIPLALILTALYLIALYLSQVFAGMFVGTLLAKYVSRPKGPAAAAEGTLRVWLLLLGIIVYRLVVDVLLGWRFDTPAGTALTALGGFLQLAFGLWALGALIEGKRKLFRHE